MRIIFLVYERRFLCSDEIPSPDWSPQHESTETRSGGRVHTSIRSTQCINSFPKIFASWMVVQKMLLSKSKFKPGEECLPVSLAFRATSLALSDLIRGVGSRINVLWMQPSSVKTPMRLMGIFTQIGPFYAIKWVHQNTLSGQKKKKQQTNKEVSCDHKQHDDGSDGGRESIRQA